jgi:hypothetical protein
LNLLHNYFIRHLKKKPHHLMRLFLWPIVRNTVEAEACKQVAEVVPEPRLVAEDAQAFPVPMAGALGVQTVVEHRVRQPSLVG